MNPDRDLAPAAWLVRARERSQQLVKARLAGPRPPLGPLGDRRPTGRAQVKDRPLVWMVAFGVALLLAGGAWALVAHVRVRHQTEAPRPLSPSAAAATPARITRSIEVGVEVAPAKIAPRPSRRHATRATAKAPAMVRVSEEPLGDVIIVQPKIKQAPLFSPEEYRARGLQPLADHEP
jgi:hypothetical protein